MNSMKKIVAVGAMALVLGATSLTVFAAVARPANAGWGTNPGACVNNGVCVNDGVCPNNGVCNGTGTGAGACNGGGRGLGGMMLRDGSCYITQAN